MNKRDSRRIDDLLIAILVLRNSDEALDFFRDLLTEPELIECSKRWQAAKMLSESVSYADIVRETGLSSTTVARVSKWLQSGLGGYKLIIERLQNQK
jgi:TrpR-related protein YerC/YecD